MEKGKGYVRKWAIDFAENQTQSSSSRDIPDPLGFDRASQDQVPPFSFHSRPISLTDQIPFLFSRVYELISLELLI